ncbi:serine hydrolase domain-containing protein [Sphingobacterium yanglingense]|uniref:CubicO group peptidase (Beta-lactamase class C family) n=1 Tax=Sphingobacterium yanglingense TaxID=1437280 RepID=A0A4R6W8P0_9SPHI|nr:serine hydrolase domain-containing protein [Sphingobacterium yanglingense]TDQ73931.1 CubicO group peptidase (beta-lactamase class C family) [Sphingobacterium yanglingense]
MVQIKNIIVIGLSIFLLSTSLYNKSVAQGKRIGEIELNDFVEKYAEEHRFNGTILIQKGGKEMYHQSFGLAERAYNTPMTNESVYPICSITKTFTAVLILQLVEQGKIVLSEKLHTYLPQYAEDAAHKVSVHELLNHTSGIANPDTIRAENFMKYGLGFYQHPYSLKDMVYRFSSRPLIHEPGDVFSYSNGDYLILGLILENIYQKPYENIVYERILQPLGMTNSGMLSHYKLIKGLTSSYFKQKDGDSLIPNIPIYMGNFYSAGGMYSTTSDLLKFDNALFGLKLIEEETLDKLLSPGLDDYGYSVWIKDTKGENRKYKRMERYGQIAGANAVWFHFLEEDVTIIILSNTNCTDLGDFALKIAKSVF